MTNIVSDPRSRAMNWVDRPLLAEALARLPPPDLSYPVDDEAVREGRWQQHVVDALERYGYTYFTPSHSDPAMNGAQNCGNAEPCVESAEQAISGGQGGENSGGNKRSTSLGLESPPARTCSGVPLRVQKRGPIASKLRGGNPLVRRKTAQETMEQSRGLLREMRQATHTARTSLEVGDLVETCCRRANKLQRPRVDANTWHPGRLVTVHRDSTVDVVFQDGDRERLNRVSHRHVRLAPECPGDRVGPPLGTEGLRVQSQEGLSAASRRELVHIASATNTIRRSWRSPVTMAKELARLRGLREERASKPPVAFETRTRAPLEGSSIPARRPRRAGQANHDTTPPKSRQPQPLMLSDPRQRREGFEKPGRQEVARGHEQQGRRCHTEEAEGTPDSLAAAQSRLVSSAIEYERCVAAVRDCIAHGVASFREARTHSEQQEAFKETTAALGPAQPARAGYTDWRGRPVRGLQSATLEVAEAMEAWAEEWARHRGREDGGSRDQLSKGKRAHEAPPFLWEGGPLVLRIVNHTEELVGATPELKEWYGPGFPVRDNPFCMAYPITDRPPTPRDAMVQTHFNGHVSHSAGRYAR